MNTYSAKPTKTGLSLDGIISMADFYGDEKDNTITGGLGNDSIYGRGGNDTLKGASGNDRLYGESGNDILDGGSGNDYLDGSADNDNYVFGKGYGYDTIYDSNYYGATTIDTVQFTKTVTPADVLVTRNATDLFLSLKGTTDVLTVQYEFSDGAYTYNNGIEQAKFSDGTVWDLDDIKALMPKTGGDNGDILWGFDEFDDTLQGLKGNDTLYGLAGDDKLVGGTGNDSLDGGADDDALDAGAGNDKLDGGYGDDTLLGGGGNDQLNGGGYYSSTVLGHDILDGGAGNDVLYSGYGQDHLIGGAGNDVLYGNYDSDGGDWADYSAAPKAVTVNLSINVQQNTVGAGKDTLYNMHFLQGSAFNDTLTGNANNNQINGGAGNDAISSLGGSDTLTGGDGQDTFKFTDGTAWAKITDFTVADDTLLLDNSLYTALVTEGTLSADHFALITGEGNSTGLDSNDYVLYNETDGKLYYDADGFDELEPAVEIGLLGTGLAMTHADVVVI